MITHIVLFKFKDTQNIKKAKDVLDNMKGKIPQLRFLEVGMDILRSERSYDIALITKFDSLSDLLAYQAHPVHVQVSGYITSIKESSIAVDFESDKTDIGC